MKRPETASKIALLSAVSGVALMMASQAHAQLGTPTVLVGNATTEAGVDAADPDWTINQTGARVVLQWDSMDIASDESVLFNQAASSNIAVNRIIGGNGFPSDGTLIDGVLSANGNVWIIDPNGVTFGANANVDVNGLVASTLDFAELGDAEFFNENQAFVDGDDIADGVLDLVFDVAGAANSAVTTTALDAGNPDGGISATGGNVALVADTVVHGGVIETTNVGITQLVGAASGYTLTVDISNGNGLIEVPISSEQSVVRLAGSIAANGGTVQITAKGANAAVESIVSPGAIVEANTISINSDGTISLTNPDNDFTGAVDATAAGAIEVVDTNALDITAESGTAGSLTASNTVDVTADGTLTVSALGNAVTVSGTDVTLGDIDTERDGSNAGGTLDVTATIGVIDDGAEVVDGADLDIAGVSIFNAVGSITLDDGTNDFGDLVTATASGTSGGISIQDQSGLNAVISAGTLGNLGSGNDITVEAGAALTATATGNDISLRGNSVTIGTVTTEADTGATGGTLTVNASSSISGGAVTVADTASLTVTAGTISLTNNANDFQDDVTATAGGTTGAIALFDASDLSLTQANAGTFDSIETDNIVDVSAGGNLSVAEALGNDITLTGMNVSLGNIDAQSDGLNAGGVLAVTATDPAGTITDGADAGAGLDVRVRRTSTFIAPGGITLDDSTNDFGGPVTATATSTTGFVIINDASNLSATVIAGQSGSLTSSNTVNVTASATLTVSALGSDVTLSGASVVLNDIDVELDADNAGGNLTVNATATISDDIEQGVGDDVNVAGVSILTGPAGIELNDTTNDFVGGVTATSATSSGFVDLADINALTVDGLTVGTGVLTTSNVVTLIAGDNLDVSSVGPTLTANAITLSGTDIQLPALEALTVGGTGGTLDITSQGSIDDTGLSLTAQGNSSFTSTAGSVTLTNGSNSFGGILTANAITGSVTINSSNALDVVVSAANDVTVTSDGVLTASASSTSATETISLSGTSVTLGDIDADGALTATASGGAIDDGGEGVAGDDVDVAGLATFNSSTDVFIDDASNNFGGAVNASGTSIALGDRNGIELGDIDTGGLLTVTVAAGSISDGAEGAAGEDLNVGGAASFVVTAPGAGSQITIDDSTNVLGGTLTASGFDVTMVFPGARVVDSITATNNLTLEAAGDLSGGPLDVTGTSTLTSTAGSVTFTNALNDFGGLVTATAITSVAIDAANSLNADVTAGTPGSVTAANTVDLTALGGDLTASASGNVITLTGENVVLGDLDADQVAPNIGGTLTVLATALDGTIADGASGTITIEGDADLTGPGGITVDNLTNDFVGDVTAVADSSTGSISIRDTDDLNVISAQAGTLGNITTSNIVTLVADGALTVAQSIGNVLDFSGSSVVLGDIDAFQDDATSTGGTLAVVASSGGIDDSDAILVEGTSTLTANTALLIDDTDADFGDLVTATSITSSVSLTDANDLSTVMTASTSATATATDALTASADAASVVLSGSSVVLGDIDSGGVLTVTATTGSIADAAATTVDGDVDVAGVATFNAATDVLVDDATNNFVGAVNASGSGVVLGDRNGIELGDIDTSGVLTVTVAAGSISDGAEGLAGEDLNVGGAATFTVTAPAAGSAITIDDASNVFASLVSASGFDVTMAFPGAQVLGGITATNNLSLTAVNNLSGGPLIVTGTSQLTSTSGSVLFTDAGNSFGGLVTADAGDDINLSEDGGDLSVVANATDMVTLLAGGALDVSSTGTATSYIGATIAVGSASASSLVASATGNITGGSAVVTGTSNLNSTNGSITLTNNNFQGQVTANAQGANGSITLEDIADLDVIVRAGTGDPRDSIHMVALTASDLLTVSLADAHAVTATGSNVVLGDVRTVQDGSQQGGTLMVTASNGMITDSDALSIQGLAVLDATGDIDLDDGSTDFMDLVTATSTGGGVSLVDVSDLDVVLSASAAASAAAGGALTATAAGGAVALSGTTVTLGDIDSGGILMVTANSGGIDDDAETTAGGDVDAAGDATFAAVTTITLDDTTNNFGGEVTASTTTGSITVADIDDLNLRARAGASGSITAANTVTANADGVLTLIEALGNAVVVTGTSVELGDIDAEHDAGNSGGALTVVASSGSITDGAEMGIGDDLNVDGDASFVVTTPAAGSAIIVDDTTNVVAGMVSASGFDVSLGFAGAQMLAAVTATNDLTVTTGGDLTGGPLVVTGVTTITSSGGSVTLTDAGNNFGSTVTVNASNDITLSEQAGDLDISATAGGDVDLTSTGTLTVNSAGNDTSLTGAAIAMNGVNASTLAASAIGDITGSTVSVSGASTLTTTTGAIDLADNDFQGSVTANAAGDVTLTQDGDFDVAATGAEIILASVGDLEASADGSSVELYGSNIIINSVTSASTLLALADMMISGGDVNVGGVSTLTAQSDITLSSTNNVFGGGVAASGGTINLGSMGELALVSIDAGGGLIARTASGDIVDADGPVTVAGDTALTSAGAVILDNPLNDFSGTVSATGSSIHLIDATGLALGDIDTAGTFRIVFDADGVGTGEVLSDADGATITVTGATDLSTGLSTDASILSATDGASIDLDNGTHRFAGGLALRRIGGSATVTETGDASAEALTLRNLEVGGDLTISTGRSIVLVGRLTDEANGVFGLDPRLESGQSSDTFAADQGTDGLEQASFHLFIPDDATWTFDTTANGTTNGADVRFDRPIDSLGSSSLLTTDVSTRQSDSNTIGALSVSAGIDGEVRFRDFVGANRPLGLARVLTAGSVFIGSTRATSPENPEDDAFLMARSANPVSNNDLNLRDFFFASSLTFEDVIGAAQVLVPDVHAQNGFEFFGINVTGGSGTFEDGVLAGRSVVGFVFGGDPDNVEVFGGIAPGGSDIIRGRSGGLVADGINISARTTFNGCQVGDTSSCINLEIPVVVTAPQNTLTVDTVAMDDPNDSNFLAFGNEQLWANPATFFILAPLPRATEE